MKRAIVACAAMTVLGGNAYAQMSAQNADWGKGPVQFIMTKDEAKAWKAIKNDADAQAFIDLFWARRDPTPTTPVNEFRDEFDRRVEAADSAFAQGKQRGSMTDRGKTLLVLGKATRMSRLAAAPGQGAAFGSDEAQSADRIPRQMWAYDQAQSTFDLGQPTVEVVFADQFTNNDWKIERTGRVDVTSLFNKANQAAIKNPNLTVAPKFAEAAPAAAPTPAPAAAPVAQQAQAAAPAAAGTIKTEALRTAVDEFKAAKSSPIKKANFTYTEMVSPEGKFFVPVQLYVPASAGVSADAVTTFFGVVEDASGNRVAAFEEPAKLEASGTDLYFDKSLDLPAGGKYTATLGLAGADGKPVVMTTSPLELKDLKEDTVGLSRLMLLTDMHETTTAAPPAAPYAFGRLKLVPKGDRVFKNTEEITYAIELLNPSVDEATGLPKIQVKLELSGTADGKPVPPIRAPRTDVPALPLSGNPGPGNYLVISGIALGQMKNPLPPGDYKLSVNYYDAVSKKSITTEESFKLVSGK